MTRGGEGEIGCLITNHPTFAKGYGGQAIINHQIMTKPEILNAND